MRGSPSIFQCAIVITNQIHVAILDDDPTIRTALVRLLKATGMVAHAHATSNELFESAARKCPDCLLLDLEMPEMDGLDVLKCLNQRNFRIPTIIITGHPEKVSQEARMNAEIIAVCHHGMRSADATGFLLQQGFGNVKNLIGGMDAWSTQVDPSVPRY